MAARKRTHTSKFGSAGRSSHDASSFYAGRLYSDQQPKPPTEATERSLPPELLDRLELKLGDDRVVIGSS